MTSMALKDLNDLKSPHLDWVTFEFEFFVCFSKTVWCSPKKSDLFFADNYKNEFDKANLSFGLQVWNLRWVMIEHKLVTIRRVEEANSS